MSADKILEMLDQFEEMIPDPPAWHGVGLIRHDWRGVWAYAKHIQELFNSESHDFPSHAARQAAWDRFNRLRDRASAIGNAERDAFRAVSATHRDAILDMCSGIEYSPVSDVLFFFDQTNADQVKQWGKYLGKAMQALSARKHEMVAEDKQLCFERIQRVKESHDLFWNEYREARAARREQVRERRQAVVDRIQRNQEANFERLRKATEALRRQRERIEELEEKVASSTSDKWRAIHGSWLEEAETRLSEIAESVERIQEWISEDERRIRELGE